MAQESLRAMVRQWRELLPKYKELKPLLSEARRIEETERNLRKEIGEAMGDKLSVIIDGRMLIHNSEERNNGLDYEKAWHEVMKQLPARKRRKFEVLLKPKIVILHKLATE